MPARVDPCLATLVDKPPKGSDWAYEVKGTCVDATEDASGNLPRYRHVVRRWRLSSLMWRDRGAAGLYGVRGSDPNRLHVLL